MTKVAYQRVFQAGELPLIFERFPLILDVGLFLYKEKISKFK